MSRPIPPARFRQSVRWSIASLLAAAAPGQTILNVTTVSEAALRAALVQANVSPSPVTVNLMWPAGTSITLSATLPRMTVADLTIQAPLLTSGQRIVLDGGNTTGVLRLSSFGATIRNLAFRRAGRNVPGAAADGVIVFGADRVLFQDCDFEDHTGIGLWLVGSTNTTVDRCGFRLNLGPGMRALDGSDHLRVTNQCVFANNQLGGFVVGGVVDVRIDNSQFDQNVDGVSAIALTKDFEFGPNNVVRRTTTGAALSLQAVTNAYVHDNVFVDNQNVGLSARDKSTPVRVENNQFLRNPIAQISLRDLTDVRVLGNLVDAGSGDGILIADSSGVVVGPSSANPAAITNNGRSGLFLDGNLRVTLQGLAVSGNLATGAAGAQIQCTDTVGAVFAGGSVTAPAPGGGSNGIAVLRGGSITIGGGMLVSGHAGRSIVLQDTVDVVLGLRPGSGTGGGLTDRNNALGMQWVNSDRVRMGGTPGDPATTCTIESAGAGSAIALNIFNCRGCQVGPAVLLDTRRAAGTNLQIDNGSVGIVVDGVTLQGHAIHGIAISGGEGIEIRNCTIDGGLTAPPATGIGLVASNVTAGGLRLLNSLVRRHGGDGVQCSNCRNVEVGPGVRVHDNGGDQIVAQNPGALTPPPVIALRSVSGVGRGTGNIIRFVSVDARLTNVTATRGGFGLVLQGTASATVVDSIFHGNGTNDRFKEATATGAMSFSIYATSSGTWTGANNLVSGIANYPGFANAAGFDVDLVAGSPAIDSGTHATPSGVSLAPVDHLGRQRIRGLAVDRGAAEFGAAAVRLDVKDGWLRDWRSSTLEFRLDAGVANAGQGYLLLGTGSGTGPALALPGGGALPLVGDAWSSLLLAAPALSAGSLDGQGRRKHTLPIPLDVVLLLPRELTFCVTVTPATTFVSNPVVVRFLR